MDGLSSTHRHTDDLRPVVLLGALTATLAACLLALECVIACVLLVRRAQGALTLSASPGWLIVWMALAVAVAAATRLAVSRWACGDSRLAGAARFLPTVALLLTALALTSFRAPSVVLIVWVLVAVEEGAIGFLLRQGFSGTLDRLGLRIPRWPGFDADPHETSVTPVINERPCVPPFSPLSDAPRRFDVDTPASTAQFSQRLERVHSLGGTDLLTGTFMARFTPGQVTAHVHVAFCPPFSRVPRLDYRQLAGPTARIKVGQVLPHGVRFDLKLEKPASEPATLCLELRASHVEESGALGPEADSGPSQ